VTSAGVVFCGVLLGGHLIWYIGGWGSEDLRAYVTDGMYPPIALLFTLLGVRVVRRPELDPRTRLAWSVIAASFVCQLIAHSSWFVEDVILHDTTYPSFADYWFLIFDPIMFVGLLLLPAARRSRSDKVKLTLDALVVGASTFMVLWYLVLGPIFAKDGATITEVAYSAALPVGDLLLVLALATVLLRRTRVGADKSMLLLAGAVATYVVADVYYGFIQLHAGFVGGTWPDLFWLLGCYLFALSAHRRYRQARAKRPPERGHRTEVNWLPYGAIALAYGLLGVLARKEGLYPFGGMIIGAVILTFLVVVRQMYALRENRDLAVTDALTGLANRTLVTERLAQVTARPIRPGRCSAVLLIDLDRFKPINDAYGHEAGDAVLCAVAAALRTVVRPGDTAGRLGGDEFAVIMPNLPSRAAVVTVGERLLEAFRTPVVFGDQLLAVEASIGIAIRDESDDTVLLLAHADAAMYHAKRSGRGRLQVYTAELDTRNRDADLRRAIDCGELIVYFQPVVDLHEEQIVATEALVRWAHPIRGLLMPEEFIELAEETGAIVPLGEWVLREACAQAARWRPDTSDADLMRLSVNLSPKQVAQSNLVDMITGILTDTGFPAEKLVLELTESVILEPSPAMVARLEALRKLDIGLAVDDFGTGFSALSYLHQLPVNILKVDRSFVTGIAEDSQARKVADAVVRLGEAFGVTVVAEGIETAEQADALRAMGCRYGQGFFYHRPMDGDAMARVACALTKS
jgi:diguanylate cyclase (GGDEF)-like protein